MNRRWLLVVTLVLALGWGEAVWAESARSLVAQGNALYAAGKFEAAKKLYEAAVGIDPKSPEAQYDLGNARYKLNDLEGAAEAYRQAIDQGRDPALISKGEFNLGNTAFRQGEAAQATDPQAAMHSFEESIAHFRSALDLAADFKEAGRNLEVSKRRLQQVREELQRQQAAKDEAQRRQEQMAKDLEQMAQEQQGLADRSRDEAGKPQADNEAMDSQAGEQQEMKDKTEALRQQMGQGAGQEQAAQDLDEAEKQQQEAVDKLRAHKPDAAAKAQDEAAQAMREAREQLAAKDKGPPAGDKQEPSPAGAKEQPQDNKQGGQQPAPADQSPGQTAKPSTGTEEEGKAREQTAQDLLNEEKQNMIQRRRQGTTGVEAVDKDW